MRLLRLISNPTSSSTLSEFENYFKDNISIKPFSKIGLLNLSCPIYNTFISIDDASNQFTFKTANTASTRTTILPNGTYTFDDFLTLLNQISNKALSFDQPSDIGFLLNFSSVSTSNQSFTLNIYRNPQSPMDTNAPAGAVVNNITIAGNTLTRTDPTTTSNDAFIYGIRPILDSCSYVRATILTSDEMVLFLTNTMAQGATNFAFADIQLGIGIRNDAVNLTYYYVINGVMTDSNATGVDVNDVLEIRFDDNTIIFRVYKGAADDDGEILHTINGRSVNNQYHPVIALVNTDVQCSIPNLIYDQRYTFNADGHLAYNGNSTSSIIQYAMGDTAPEITVQPSPPKSLGNIIFTLSFTSEALRNILGFTVNSLSDKGVALNWTASAVYNALVIPKNLIVELVSLKLDSIDGLLGTRRNIIAVIPSINMRDNYIVYETANPLMLDLNNQFEINLRSLRVKILTRTDEEDLLDVSDQIELTLLID